MKTHDHKNGLFMRTLIKNISLSFWICLVWTCGCEMADDADNANDSGFPERDLDTASSLPYSMPSSFSCSSNVCTWTSEPINISGASEVLISADARGDQYGQFESSDYLKLRYSVDGGSWTTFFSHTDDLAPRTVTKSISNTGGNTIRIRITAKTSASNESYKVNGLSVKSPTTDPACLVVDPYPSKLQNPETLNAAQGKLRFVARDGNTLTAYTHRSASFDAKTGKIVFIMHGAGRNASSYLDAWRKYVEQAGAFAIAPEFPTSLYPDSEDYNLGVGTAGTPSGSTYDPSEWRNPNDTTHSEIEHLFEAVRKALGNATCRYAIYGHSAGGQFVHRLVTFRPDARFSRAVAANSGWYTLPSTGGGRDSNFYMPYGLQGAPPDATRLEKMFGRDLVVLLGEDDVVRDDDFRTTRQADAQGLNRFERGNFYFSMAKKEASAAGVAFRWTLDTVPGVAHSNSGMAGAAAKYLFAP